MRALVIIYDFQNSIINNKRALEDRIRGYGQYAFMSKNACIIFTDATVVSVRDYLIAALSAGDKLYVGETSAPAAWHNLQNEVSNYIKDNLK